MEKKPRKLVLNQETLRNLTEHELENVVGGFQSRVCPTTFPLTCPECPSPLR